MELQTLTLRRVLERSAELFADQPALSQIGGTPITFRELLEHATTVSALLAEQGVARGDRVAILSESMPNWGIAYFAITAMGAVAVPILPEFHADAVHHIIRHSEAKVVFVSERLFPKLEDGQFDTPPELIQIENFHPVQQGVTRDKLRELKERGMREFRRLRDKAMRLTHLAPEEPGEDDVAAIIYTSGTTGHSKGVVLTHRNIVWDADAVKSIVRIAPGDRMLSILPLSHTYECTLGGGCTGCPSCGASCTPWRARSCSRPSAGSCASSASAGRPSRPMWSASCARRAFPTPSATA